jgi:hypothetical protein
MPNCRLVLLARDAAPTDPVYFSGTVVGFGGGGGIRTHERLSPLPVFKTGAFNRSATPPVIATI